MRFISYLTEGRSKPLEMDEFHRLLNSGDYSDILRNINNPKCLIFRGIFSSAPMSYIDPTKGRLRRSANTSNEYMLLIDNFPDWRKFPKRSKSLICSTNIKYADDYGYIKLVLPQNGAKLGVCPSDDFWNSFNIVQKELSIHNMAKFNRELGYIIGQDVDDDWTTLRNAIYRWDITDLPFLPDEWQDVIQDNGTLMKALRYLLDPKLNKFQIKSIGDILPRNVEVWTDSPCLLVNVEEGNIKNTIDFLTSHTNKKG